MYLMIVESPGKLAKLREIMSKVRPGETWQIEPSIGHIRDLPSTGNNEGEITTGIKQNLMPVYELTERGGEVVQKLEKAVARASVVFLATDPDREGESIAWHLKEALAIKNPVRISFNEVTEGKVREALDNQGVINMRLVSAQECRRVLDRLVGYLVSPELRRQTGQNLPAGRVQSVAVWLVVARERAIRAFTAVNHFSAELFFAGAKTGEAWSAEWETYPEFVTDENPYFMDRTYAEAVSAVRNATVVSFAQTEKLRNPPPPFTTSTLQQAASNSLEWGPEVTMKIAQQLFDQGHISYHRTDNPNVSEESMPDIRATANALGLEVVAKRREFQAKDGAQAGHPGITPTHWEVNSAGETDEQRALYSLIRNRALASQLMPARYDARTVVIQANDPVGGKRVQYKAKGRTLLSPGWLRLLTGDATEDSDDREDDGNPLPVMAPGQTLCAVDGAVIEMKTRAPKRYTKASLIKTLEAERIGRPSTYAAIISNITGRDLICEDSSRFLKPLPSGELCIERLEGNFSFLDVGYTCRVEADLDGIAEGRAQYKGVIQDLYGTLSAELAAQQAAVPRFVKVEPVYDCPSCQRPMRKLKGEHGAFWSCTGYPDHCKETLPDDKGRPGAKKTIALSEHACGKCQKPLIRRHKKGKTGYDFWGCSGFKEGCDAKYPNIKGKNTPKM
ncbi:DNA topoisomerase 1 [Pseudomonas fluorescens]|uniref:DNA topoisomerase n=1 Tax=Pseudomonas fluorescens TaxID=294 RepID=UPI00123FB998|nr:DNA topoisomerase [Pseudomonas fluorescens]VVN22244.1 DNA topoisomerase 1 [Pseudomonas fluorescens]